MCIVDANVERLTRTVFSDVDGAGPALANLLGDANVRIADTLESAFDSDSEVLVLYLEGHPSKRLSAETLAALRARKLVVTGDGADWLCRELDLEIGGGMVTPVAPLEMLANDLLASERPYGRIRPLLNPPERNSFALRQDTRHLEWRHIADELRVGRGARLRPSDSPTGKRCRTTSRGRNRNCPRTAPAYETTI